jgi:hypothetical protein
MENWSTTQVAWVSFIIIFAYLVLKRAIDFGTDYFLKRGVGTDYVSVASCKETRELCIRQREIVSDHRAQDMVAVKNALFLLVDKNPKITAKEKAEIRKGLITT